LEISTASSAFQAGATRVEPGDYVVRGDQPFRTLAEMYFSIQNYPPQNPAPYDDTGWTFQLMRNLRVIPIGDAAILGQRMSPVTSDVKATGGIVGTGKAIVIEQTADNNLATFRFRNPAIRMVAAETEFDVRT